MNRFMDSRLKAARNLLVDFMSPSGADQVTYLLSLSHLGVSGGQDKELQLHSPMKLTQVAYRSRPNRRETSKTPPFTLSRLNKVEWVKVVTSTWASDCNRKRGWVVGTRIRRPELALDIYTKVATSSILPFLSPSLLDYPLATCCRRKPNRPSPLRSHTYIANK